MNFGVVVFPGSSGEQDAVHVLGCILGQECRTVWHRETDLSGFDAIILPGGSSFGDYLRSGALAARSPVMDSVRGFAREGGLVLGICNGFQILLEAGILPGAMLPNDVSESRSGWQNIRVETDQTAFTGLYQPREVLRMPIAHGHGNYYAEPPVMSELKESGCILFRYVDQTGKPGREANPNGSLENIAGIMNSRGNVLGMMPHPERCSETTLGGADGRKLFLSMIESMAGPAGRFFAVKRKGR